MNEWICDPNKWAFDIIGWTLWSEQMNIWPVQVTIRPKRVNLWSEMVKQNLNYWTCDMSKWICDMNLSHERVNLGWEQENMWYELMIRTNEARKIENRESMLIHEAKKKWDYEHAQRSYFSHDTKLIKGRGYLTEHSEGMRQKYELINKKERKNPMESRSGKIDQWTYHMRAQ